MHQNKYQPVAIIREQHTKTGCTPIASGTINYSVDTLIKGIIIYKFTTKFLKCWWGFFFGGEGVIFIKLFFYFKIDFMSTNSDCLSQHFISLLSFDSFFCTTFSQFSHINSFLQQVTDNYFLFNLQRGRFTDFENRIEALFSL